MRLKLINTGSCDDGEYITVELGAGGVEAEVTVEDGTFGQKITVRVNGEAHVIGATE